MSRTFVIPMWDRIPYLEKKELLAYNETLAKRENRLRRLIHESKTPKITTHLYLMLEDCVNIQRRVKAYANL